MRNLSKNVEILPSKRFESHLQSANGLNDLSESKMTNMDPVMEPIFTKNDTLFRSRNPENDTLFSGTSPYRKIYEYPSRAPTRENLLTQKLCLAI